MYISDYLYSVDNSDTRTCYEGYGPYCVHSWIHISNNQTDLSGGAYGTGHEWTMAYNNYVPTYKLNFAVLINYSGNSGHNPISEPRQIRPVFYLDSNVNVDLEISNGSENNPYLIKDV